MPVFPPGRPPWTPPVCPFSLSGTGWSRLMAANPPSVARALTGALKARPPEPRGLAIVALAKRLAAELDTTTDPDVLAKLAPRLLATLVELGMGRGTAAAVTSGQDGGGGSGGGVTVDELRGRRRARSDPSPAVDSASG